MLHPKIEGIVAVLNIFQTIYPLRFHPTWRIKLWEERWNKNSSRKYSFIENSWLFIIQWILWSVLKKHHFKSCVFWLRSVQFRSEGYYYPSGVVSFKRSCWTTNMATHHNYFLTTIAWQAIGIQLQKSRQDITTKKFHNYTPRYTFEHHNKP